jgi:hypothetical protein
MCRRAAHLACGVTLGEAYSISRDTVYIRVLIEITASGPEVTPTQIIGQNEQNVWLFHLPPSIERTSSGALPGATSFTPLFHAIPLSAHVLTNSYG